MEINVDLLIWVLIGAISWHYGKKKGYREGRRTAYEEERVYRIEEQLEELKAAKEKK